MVRWGLRTGCRRHMRGASLPSDSVGCFRSKRPSGMGSPIKGVMAWEVPRDAEYWLFLESQARLRNVTTWYTLGFETLRWRKNEVRGPIYESCVCVCKYYHLCGWRRDPGPVMCLACDVRVYAVFACSYATMNNLRGCDVSPVPIILLRHP